MKLAHILLLSTAYAIKVFEDPVAVAEIGAPDAKNNKAPTAAKAAPKVDVKPAAKTQAKPAAQQKAAPAQQKAAPAQQKAKAVSAPQPSIPALSVEDQALYNRQLEVFEIKSRLETKEKAATPFENYGDTARVSGGPAPIFVDPVVKDRKHLSDKNGGF